MNEKLENTVKVVSGLENLSEEEKIIIISSLKDADKQLSVSAFKIERLEKVKYTTTVLLEQTINELESKRKAVEDQKHELEIEAALERVRAKAMAMHSSKDLSQVALALFREVKAFGGNPGTCGFVLCDQNKTDDEYWVCWESGVQPPMLIPHTTDPTTVNLYKGWESGADFYAEEKTGGELKAHFNYMLTVPTAREVFENWLHLEGNFPEWQRWHAAYFKQGFVFVITHQPYPQEQIFKRFAPVFGQAYTRFLDLKNAEAQAREAQIEAALERVRASAMAMHTSQQLHDVVKELRKQIGLLGQNELDTCVIQLYDESTDYVHSYASMKPSNNKEDIREFYRLIPKKGLVIIEESLQAYSSGDKDYTLVNEKGKSEQWMSFMKDTYPEIYAAAVETLGSKPEKVPTYWSFSDFNGGSLLMVTLDPPNDSSIKLLRKFANVFGLAYRRFVDIKKAEANARESQIEAALEKVRGKAMAMHNSDDLSVTASMVFTELRKLGITPIRCGVGILTRESHKAQLYSATSSQEKDSLSLVGWVLLEGHPVLEKIYDTWLKREDYYPELSGEQLKSYYELLLAGLSVKVPDWQNGQKQYGHFFSFSIGCLYAWSETPYKEDEIKILKRFASIIDLTFRRYIELQKSEANARETFKQAALDRVRAEIASMRTVKDLERITPLIWNELTILGIPFIRCGVFIMDDSERLIHTFLSTPDGKSIAAFHISFDAPGNIAQVLRHWREKKDYIDHWDENAFIEFADTLVKHGALDSSAQYLETIPHGGFYLHFVPFLQGMLYVGNSSPLNSEEIKLIQSLADAFSTAYARYEDFNKLEVAKKQVDSTLHELRATQKQLIQSEKMASLGELTAGIAHEIQNPLNFVNNFAEINTELIEELKIEIGKANFDEVTILAQDLKDNNQKIIFHGKRADSIVKGMLQHSRTTSGKKELTDINALADEFLRLSYHGLRAKDKSFNASMQTDFDHNVGKIPTIPQDLGRVLLNLFNNAFYSVNEKKKRLNGLYDPLVFVGTQKQADKVCIIVKDNGNGIPQKIIDKIYQPFFTTKPTGEGTGLGLSLSYDIITKGHNGELKVDTIEGEFAVFEIIIPVKT